jgi:hypothetical protein
LHLKQNAPDKGELGVGSHPRQIIRLRTWFPVALALPELFSLFRQKGIERR